MKKTAGLAVLALAAFAAAGWAKPPDPYARLQEILARFNAAYDVENGAGDVPALRTRDCLAGFTVSRLAESYGNKAWKPADVPDFTALFSQLVLYQTSRALEAEDPGRCAAGGALMTDPFPIGKHGDLKVSESCAEIYQNLAWTRALASKRPGLKDFCLKLFGPTKVIRPEDMGGFCDALIAVEENPREAAAKISRYHPAVRLDREPDFESILREMSGLADETACVKYSLEPEDHEKCLALARYRKARAAGRASRCGSAALCRVMMGSANAGAVYERKAAEIYCGRLAAGATLQELRALIAEGTAALASVSARSEPRYARWRRKILDLQPRLDDLERRAGRVRSPRDPGLGTPDGTAGKTPAKTDPLAPPK